MLGGCNSGRSIRIPDPASSLCGPQGTRRGSPQRGRHSHRRQTSAAHRSAAMAGGARPDPFRTRKLSRRAPMVLRGQPVGEQGAADRWTALDPYVAGSGAGAPRGIPSAAPPSFPPVSFSRGPPGPFFHAAGTCDRAPHPLAACLRAGRSHPCRQRGRTAPSPRRAPFLPGACGRMPLRAARPFTGAAPRGPPRQVAVPLCAGGLAGIPREPLCRPPAAPAGQGPGARSAGTVRGRRFGCRELGRPPCLPPV